MKIMFIILALFFCKESFAQDVNCKDKQISEIVSNIGGKENIDEQKKDMHFLSKKAYVASGCLIKGLHTVREKKIRPEETNKHRSALDVIWRIRVLRYLTRIDFKGSTRYKFTKIEAARKHFLTLESKNELPFFSTTMSHEVIYIAPVDTQIEIIQKWKDWYKVSEKTFIFKSSDDFDKWYY